MPRDLHEELPRFVEPMLARSAPPPPSDGWALEVKWDGIRPQIIFDGHTVTLRSRRGRDCTNEFPEIQQLPI
ncbi:MAG: hypothetical protein JO227_21840, partial [Acetobacteraceae bacterium]|nr:hypothetical protein [Acetobacteraceae bacterium]